MTIAVAASVLALFVATVALVVVLRQRKVIHGLIHQIETLKTTLREQRHEVKSEMPLANRFSAHLRDAEESQLNNQMDARRNRSVKPQAQADRYRYAVALAAQGQNVDSIAQALNMAPAEVEQVMQLARVKLPA